MTCWGTTMRRLLLLAANPGENLDQTVTQNDGQRYLQGAECMDQDEKSDEGWPKVDANVHPAEPSDVVLLRC